jgi:hypothetical protein
MQTGVGFFCGGGGFGVAGLAGTGGFSFEAARLRLLDTLDISGARLEIEKFEKPVPR